MDEVEAEMERREQREGLIAAISDAIRLAAGGKWVEVRDREMVFAINARNVVSVVPCCVVKMDGLTAFSAAGDHGDAIGEGRFFTHIGNKPATIENWMQAVEG